MDPVRESTPVDEQEEGESESRNVSSFLGRFGLSPQSSGNTGALIASPAKSLRDMIPRTDDVLSVVKHRQELVTQQGGDMLLTLRMFLSNSTNIWSLTALFELLYILYEIIPWAYFDVRSPSFLCLTCESN